MAPEEIVYHEIPDFTSTGWPGQKAVVFLAVKFKCYRDAVHLPKVRRVWKVAGLLLKKQGGDGIAHLVVNYRMDKGKILKRLDQIEAFAGCMINEVKQIREMLQADEPEKSRPLKRESRQ